MSSASWADRKEGLIALQNLLRGSRVLNRLELRKVTEIFTRMFHDPHGKVLAQLAVNAIYNRAVSGPKTYSLVPDNGLRRSLLKSSHRNSSNWRVTSGGDFRPDSQGPFTL